MPDGPADRLAPAISPRRYTRECRNQVLALLAVGRSVAQIAAELQISQQTVYQWRAQHLLDTGQQPGVTLREHADLVAARRRVAELESELAITRRAAELLKVVTHPLRIHGIVTVAANGGGAIFTDLLPDNEHSPRS